MFSKPPDSRARFAGWAIAGCLAASAGAALSLRFGAGWAWLLLVPCIAWLPASAWWLLHLRRQVSAAKAAHLSLQADRQVDRFRIVRRDVLTGLPNRQSFLETLAAHVAAPRACAVLVIDLDGFDLFNANFGDAAGDELLASFSARLQACAARDQAARLDGVSFGMILTAPEDLRDLTHAMQRAAAALGIGHAASGQLIDLSLSIGAAVAGAHGNSADSLLRAARLTTAQAKQAGGGRALICGHDMAEMMLHRQTTRRDLQRAIEAGQIVPYYQPIIRLQTGEIAKFEVLARWNHPKLGVLAPDQFIPIADELGLAGHISMALLHRMALDTNRWPGWCRFAINVSAGQVRDLIGLLKTQPGDWQRRMDLSRLDMEIAECALMRDCALARELIDVLHEHGARAVLDNFGSGTSNLLHLQDLPFDSIKIGKSFIQRLTRDARVDACVAAMLSLGAGLGIDIVADGVETEDVAARLCEMGCHYAQGYLYAHPVPAGDAARLLGLDCVEAEAA